jgi:hypothetical protein
MLTADYTAISVLIVLTLWAGAKRFLRGSTLFSAILRSLTFDLRQCAERWASKPAPRHEVFDRNRS